MENYKVITKDIIKIDNLKGVYVYALIKYYEDFKSHISTVTEDHLSKCTEISLSTVKRLISQLKPHFKKVETKQVDKTKKRNYYYFQDTFKNYFYIDNNFYKVPLKGIEDNLALYKGFILKLKSICKNNTNKYWNGKTLNKSKMAEQMKLDRKTLNKYLTVLLETDNLRILEDGSLFINNLYIVPDYVSNDDNTFNYHCIYKHCLNSGVVPPDREEKALYNLATEYINNPDRINWYLPEQLKIRCKNMPNKVNFAYFLKALLNNDKILKNKNINNTKFIM